MRKRRYLIRGRSWLPIGRAATILGTNVAGIRARMADGTLDWTQTRANSTVFVVDEKMVIALRLAAIPPPS